MIKEYPRTLLVPVIAFSFGVYLLVGIVLIYSHKTGLPSHALSTDSVRQEAESASLSGPIATGTDAAASGGHYVQFTANGSGSPTLPDTSANFHQFQVYSTPTLQDEAGKVDWVWEAQSPSQPAGMYNTFYILIDRDRSPSHGGHDLAWWQANHPDWIEYKCDKTSVAYYNESGGTTAIPLDITNAAVRTYQMQYYVDPAVQQGYAGISVDNGGFYNFTSYNQRCGHYDLNHSWVQQFSGQEDDPVYRAAEIAWVQDMSNRIHSSYPKEGFIINFPFDTNHVSDWFTMANAMDMVMDEAGFTNRGSTQYPLADQTWLSTIQGMQQYAASGKGLSIVNQEAGTFANVTNAQVQWAMANYLLVKGNHTYQTITGYQEYGPLLIRPEYAALIGTATDTYYHSQNVYMRDFSGGIALVNPSSTTSYAVSLPTGKYKDLYGNTIGSSLTLAPISGEVLVLATPPVCSITTPANTGIATATLNAPSAGAYTLWSRLMVPASSNSYYLQVDGGCPLQVSDLIGTNQWDWVKPQGTASLSLGAGSHTIKLMGNQTGVKIDEVLFSQTCTPSGTGDNCLAAGGPQPGDCNGDGHVNITDLSILLSHYSQSYSACDFNSDGVITILDLSVLLSHYGL